MKLHVSWGVGIALVYSAFAAATLGFVVFAAEQKIDLVSADYYQRSLDQDQRAAASANAAALHDAVAVQLTDGRTLTIVWPAEPRVTSGSIRLYRPSDSGADRLIAAAPAADSSQTIESPRSRGAAGACSCSGDRMRARTYAERIIDLR